jgi:trehalose-6-phosphatase
MSDAQAKHERPWEDTLILAFRDMQWIERVSNEALDRTELAQTPGLLLKIHGARHTLSYRPMKPKRSNDHELRYRSD